MDRNNRHIVNKTILLFTFYIFIIMLLSFLVIGGITFALLQLDILSLSNPGAIIFGCGIVSLLIGTGLAILVVQRFIRPILNIADAIKRVADGDFSITVDENMLTAEVNAMAHNFNTMTRELANTEIFRNDFVNNVSHEFKTPLSAIEGYATLLQSKSLSDEKREFYVAKIISNTHRLTNLTDNILQLSRLEHQEFEIKKANYSLDEQLREIVLLFENAWTEKELEIEIDLATVNYYGNADLLLQVWQNILGNAIKFIEPHGRIDVSLKQVDKNVIVSIADTGPGMSEETVQRLFEKFYQGDASHASNGNGLGMTLAKRIVDLHNGQISVSSKVNDGTTFTVTLPVK